MPNRILKESICTSETINELTPDLEVFFYRIIVQCDDFGRLDARPSILRSKCYPLRIDVVTEKDILFCLNKLSEVGLIQIYKTDDKYFLQITTWDKHQQIRAKKSKYPEPDIICNQLQSNDFNNNQPHLTSNGNQLISIDSICSRNPIQSESNPNPIRNTSEVSDEALRAFNLLKVLMTENDPKAKIPDKPEKWASDIEKINRIDGRSFEEIEDVIRFSQNDDFWKTNILSAGKLREKFGALYLKMKSNGGNGHGVNQRSFNASKPGQVRTEASEYTKPDELRNNVYG